MVQSAWVIEYTNCISAQEKDFPIECPIAQSAGAKEYTNLISAER